MKNVFSILMSILFSIGIIFQSIGAENIINKDNESIEYLKGEFIVKFIADGTDKSVNTHALNLVLTKYKVKEHQQLFKNAQNKKMAKAGNLFNVFIMYTDKNSDILHIVQELNNEKYVEYAEPNYICEVDVTEPNDTFYNLLSHLPQVYAPNAWDIQNGESGVVIGIIDSGVDWDHEDLAGIIWSNDDEVENGVDSDGNGYVDDIRGWDFVASGSNPHPDEDATTADNDPMDFHGHGTHVAGLAGAHTNNNTGVAAVSWGAKIMPLRIGWRKADGNGSGSSSYMAQAYIYAADNGAHITNLSYSNSGQTIVNAAYYAFQNGVLICESAGNNDAVTPSSLGSQDFVMCVAAVDPYDQKTSYSSYGEYVDISLPGGDHSPGLYSTAVEPSDFYSGPYTYMSGTSMACPVAASVAGLIMQAEPSMSVLDLYTRIQATADNIDGENPGYVGMLGAGRANIYRALTELVYATPVFEFITISIEDTVGNGDNDGFIEVGENFIINVTVRNSWEAATGVTAQVSTEGLWPVTIDDGNEILGDLTGIMNKTNWQTDASFYLTCDESATTAIVDVPIVLSTNEGFEETLFIPVSVCPYDIQFNILEENTGNPVNGSIKFYSVDEPSDSLFTEVDIISGVLTTQLPDGTYDLEIIADMPHEYKVISGVEINGNTNETFYLRKAQILLVDNDFMNNMNEEDNVEYYYIRALSNMSIDYPFTYHDVYVKGFAPSSEILNDYDVVIWFVGNLLNPLMPVDYTNLLAEYLESGGNIFMTGQKILLFNMANSFFPDYLQVSYESGGPTTNKILYPISGNPISGDWMFMQFSDPSGINNQFNPEIISINDESANKIFHYSPPANQNPAGIYYEDETYSYKVIYLGFGFEALVDLMNASQGETTRAQFMENIIEYFDIPPVGVDDETLLEGIVESFQLKQNYPNPFNPETNIEYHLKKVSNVELVIYNSLGQKIRTLVNKSQTTGVYSERWDGRNDAGMQMSTGVYYYRIKADNFMQMHKMLLMK